jgi:glycerol-3-phosphate dehydrogenase (NAD(P)+)
LSKACIIGGGSWGTALATVLATNNFKVCMWSRSQYVVDHITKNRCSPKLPGIRVPDNVGATTSPNEAVKDACIVVSTVPSTAVREVASVFACILPEDCIMISATKGFDPGTFSRPSEVWKEASASLKNRIAAISGPNFAVEIARKLPAATVVACPDLSIRETVQSAFITPYLRVYTHWDIIGVELGGALKNIIALACGMIEGTGLGYNAQAALISRGIAEISRLGVGLGADPLTFAGLSGLGDLVLTCTGHLSRNRQAGIAVGKGEDIETFMARTGYTVEGYTTVKSAMNISETVGVSMPITCVVYKILYQKLSVMRGLSEIMSREKRPEHEPNSGLVR